MTPLFHPAASIMLVGVEVDLAEECVRAFPELLVLRVAHLAAAVERMLVTRPLVVVLGDKLGDAEGQALMMECASDIRAEIVQVATIARADLAAAVRTQLLLAERNRDKATTPTAQA